MDINWTTLIFSLVPLLLSILGLLSHFNKVLKEQQELIKAIADYNKACSDALADGKIDNEEISKIMSEGDNVAKEGKELVEAYKEITDKLKELLAKVKK